MNRLLAHLDAELAKTVDPGTRAEVQIKQGIYRARVGDFGDAKAISQAIRSSVPLATYPRVAIQLILLEGVIDLYENLGSYGIDRILRADLLAVGTSNPGLILATSSWRAHVEFERSNFKEMAAAISRVHKITVEESQDARARCARILSDCYALIGDRQASKQWFDIAHRHAVSRGDQAMLDALIYNNVAFATSRLRSESCFSSPDSKTLRLMETALTSSRAYQALIGARALSHLVDVCSARLLMLQGNFSRALEVLSELSASGPLARNNFSDDLFNIDISYCHAMLGRFDVARNILSQVFDPKLPGIDVDDRLAAAWMRHQMALMGENLGSAEETLAHLEMAKLDFKEFESDIRNSILGMQ